MGDPSGGIAQLVAELGIEEIGRRYIDQLQARLGAVPQEGRPIDTEVTATSKLISSAIWAGDDGDGGQLPAGLWWDLAMAALHACPADDGLLWCLGDGPFDNLRGDPAVDERLLEARLRDPKVDRLFAAMRWQLPSEGVTSGFWFS